MSKNKEIIFKIKKGTHYKDDKKDITIIDMEIRQKEKIDKRGYKSILNEKWYKYICGICGWTEGWIEESNLLKGKGCSCCSGHIVVEGINDIPITAPWMVQYFQRGYNEAKLYTKHSHKKIYPICPECKRIKDNEIVISNIYSNKSIGCSCSDKISYSEKFTFSILEQLELHFKTQLSKTTFEWCDKYKYDFYFEYNEEQYIVETHGRQHYAEGFQSCGGDTLKEVQENDKLKKELALSNGIKEDNYMVIDCRHSNLEYIKNSILNNEKMNKHFDLSKTDWLNAEEFACNNLVKKICDYKRNNPDMIASQIADITRLSLTTVVKYLIRGTQLKWCNYKTQKEKAEANMKMICNLWNKEIYNIKEISKIIELSPTAIRQCLEKGNILGIIKYNSSILQDINNINRSLKIKEISCKSIISIDKGFIFESSKECSDKSEEIFGVKLTLGSISRVCRGERPHYKGFTFKFIQDLTEEQIKEIQENAKLNQVI